MPALFDISLPYMHLFHCMCKTAVRAINRQIMIHNIEHSNPIVSLLKKQPLINVRLPNYLFCESVLYIFGSCLIQQYSISSCICILYVFVDYYMVENDRKLNPLVHQSNSHQLQPAISMTQTN